MIQSFVNHISRRLELWMEHRRLRLEEKQLKREEELEAMNRALEDRRMKIIQKREERDSRTLISDIVNMEDLFDDMVTIDEEEGARSLKLKQTEITVSYTGRRIFPLDIDYNDEPIEVTVNGMIIHDVNYAFAIRDNHIYRIAFSEGLAEGSHILITLIESSSNSMLQSLPILKKEYSMSRHQGLSLTAHHSRLACEGPDSHDIFNFQIESNRNEFMHRSWTKMIEVVEVGKGCGYFFDKKYLYILTIEFNHEKIVKYPIEDILNSEIYYGDHFSIQRVTIANTNLYIEGEFMPHMNDDEVQFTGQQSIKLKGY